MAAPPDLGEALVRALQDPLCADVDPRARRHLAVHREAQRLEPAELLPRAPLRHEVRVGEQDPRRPFVGAEHADRLARLDEHRLVVGERLQRAHHGVEGVPRAGGPPRAAVHDEVVGPFGHLRIEVVHEHPHRCFLRPAAAAELGAARCPHGAWSCHGRFLLVDGHSSAPVTCSTDATTRPDITSSAASPSSGASHRSGPGPGTPASRSDGERGCGGRRRFERPAQLEGARRADELAGDDAAEVGDGAAELAGGTPSHRDVVLLHRRRGQRVDARRRGQPAVLGDHRRLRVVRDHQPRVHAGILGEERGQAGRAGPVEHAIGSALGDRSDLGGGDGEEVARHADRRAVEVPARLDPTVGQDARVVDRRARAPRRRRAGRGPRCHARRRAPGASSATSRHPAPGDRPCGGWPRWRCRRAAGGGSPPTPSGRRGDATP